MNVPGLRSPHCKTRGLVYFARMIDKIRLHAAGQLPEEYHANLGAGFDDTCCRLLKIDYPTLVERVKAGGTDDEILAWACERGHQPSEFEAMLWNTFMLKRGWKDDGSPRLAMRKAEAGLSDRADLETFFDYIDADEGRDPRHASA